MRRLTSLPRSPFGGTAERVRQEPTKTLSFGWELRRVLESEYDPRERCASSPQMLYLRRDLDDNMKVVKQLVVRVQVNTRLLFHNRQQEY